MNQKQSAKLKARDFINIGIFMAILLLMEMIVGAGIYPSSDGGVLFCSCSLGWWHPHDAVLHQNREIRYAHNFLNHFGNSAFCIRYGISGSADCHSLWRGSRSDRKERRL